MNKKSKGLIPPGLLYLADNITTKDNILGAARGTRAEWAKDLNLPKEKETIFFAGCGYQYAGGVESLMSLIRRMDKSIVGAELPTSLARFQKKLGIDLTGAYRKLRAKSSDSNAQPLKDAVKVLDSLGVEFGYLGDDEPCCGGPLHYIGLEEEFVKHAQEAYKKLKSFGVKRIIGIIPSCTYTIRNLFPKVIDGYDLEVKHLSEVIQESTRSQELHFPGEIKVTYHDPCQLSRYLGLIEEPRQILKAIKGIELIETEWTKGEWATCCGGGAGFEVVFPELSQILAVNRIKELVETGAQIIVTNCPGCIMQLKSGLKEAKTDGVEVLDLAQIVARAMEV